MNNYNISPIKTIFINKVTTTSTQVILVPSTTISASDLLNLNKYRLIIACNLKATSNLPVYIQASTGLIPLFCRFAGNNIYASQLRNRYRYSIVYGNSNKLSTIGQFVLQNSVCPVNSYSTTSVIQETGTTDTSTTTTEVVANTKSK